MKIRKDQPRRIEGDFVICKYDTGDGCNPPSEDYECDGRCMMKLETYLIETCKVKK